ncbi:tetratricopeptide repeat protein [Flavitalea antarctica]
MQKSLFVLCSLVAGGICIAPIWDAFDNTFSKSITTKTPTTVQSCAPNSDQLLSANATGKFINILPGSGDHHYHISTTNDSAQVYFNQGLSMYYSYHMKEALASFKEAAKFDSTSAMVYWGQALAMGPTYNFGYAYKMSPAVPAVVALMNKYREQASDKEKDLITAMNSRYDVSEPTDSQRKQLNESYVTALKPLVAKYNNDLDLKILYTDAVMLVHPWSFWNNDGTPKPWTEELVKNCEDVLGKDPHHPAALHYYIHLTEASRKPNVGLASADSLKKLYPGIAHMVHMSSHEYERIGYYAKGVQANEEADRSLVRYASLAPGLSLSAHVSHYYAVDAFCALSGAMYKKAVQKTATLRQSVDADHTNTYNQYLYMYPALANVRLGKWQAILDDNTSIDPQWTYAGILNDFTKGMAFAKTGDFKQAEKHLEQLRAKQKDSILRVKFSPMMSTPFECSMVAENILHATMLFNQKKYEPAFTAIKKAIHAEDSLIYSEPNLWMLPARQYLGAFLLQLKKAEEAEKIYREDLKWNPGNGWSLVGLHKALASQKKQDELKDLKSRYMNSFSDADVVPATSAY